MSESKNKIVLFKSSDGEVSLPVEFGKDTVWLTQAQMAQLFGKDRTVIGRHIRNAIEEGEIDPTVVCANFAHTTRHGAITTMKKKSLRVRALGPEIFGLTKREKMKRFGEAFCSEIGRLFGESQIDNSRYEQKEHGLIMVGCILMPSDVRRILCDPLMRYLVVLGEPDGDALHGVFAVRTVNDFVFDITDFYIEPPYRRQGYGRKMLTDFIECLRKDRKRRPAKVEISVALGNDAATAFYAKAGFRETAREMQRSV